MIYGSVSSGIEAATMAWHPLGWTPKFFAEIAAFPSAVLAHHYGSNMPGEPLAKNGIPNHGDFTKISADAGPVDLLVGGTPCQSFSIAGKRLGLDDPRGNLALEYLALAKRLGARWFVWENVPGVLSSRSGDEDAEEDEEGRFESADFATFLDFVRQCGYGFAYRVLDAQYVRVDGYARAVPQRRRRVFVVGYLGDWRPAAAVLFEPEGMRGHPAPRRDAQKSIAGSFGNNSAVAFSPKAGGKQTSIGFEPNSGTAPTLSKSTVPAVAFNPFKGGSDKSTLGFSTEHVDCLRAQEKPPFAIFLAPNLLRFLTPTECERLQGFGDSYTDVPFRGRRAPDSLRYKALGNSMAVNVMRWIGQRIDIMEGLIRAGKVPQQ
jgi:DNA (cytosine-5)-methyltransferase 1